jgi:hypothetical protein
MDSEEYLSNGSDTDTRSQIYIWPAYKVFFTL